ncbi:MAG: acyltransferase [Hyphomicrobiales bacterium]|nr:acyltransferase [Hyphomicrobiales bacterium]
MRQNSAVGLTDRHFRFRALDGYRFLAALCVVMYHYNNRFSLGLDRWLPMIDDFNLMVDFFFLLSGFVIARAYGQRLANLGDYARFLWARVARLYPLYFVTTGLAALAGWLYSSRGLSPEHPEMAWNGLPAAMLLLQATGMLDHLTFNLASWSISAEFMMYGLSPLFLRFLSRVGGLWALITAVAFALLFQLMRDAAHQRAWTEATFDYGALRALPTFLTGMVIAQSLPRLRALPIPPWALVHGGFLLILLGMNLHWPPAWLIVLLALMLTACALAELGGADNFMRGAMMGHLGDASYGLYLVHQLVAIFVPGYFGDWGLASPQARPWLALACAIASILAALASYRWLESPLRRALIARPWRIA